eukprot:1749078-Amphidinium_carterae.1
MKTIDPGTTRAKGPHIVRVLVRVRACVHAGGSKANQAGYVSQLGCIYRDLRDYDRAIAEFQTALALFIEALGSTHAAVQGLEDC